MGRSDYAADHLSKSTRGAPSVTQEFDPWLDAVLRQAVAPAWLQGDAPQSDVVISSRARLMRNLSGYPFTHSASRPELEAIERECLAAGLAGNFTQVQNLPEVQRAVLVGSRLISPEFDPNKPGRNLLLSPDRGVAIMVNEEDHLRIQAVTAGLSIESSLSAAQSAEARLAERLTFAQDSEFGFLAASTSNAGAGRRLGVMLHLGGLAASGAAPEAVRQLDAQGFEVRGLLGERSLGIAGYVQVSTTTDRLSELSDSLNVLIYQERQAKSAFYEQRIREGVDGARKKIDAQEGMNIDAATRAIGWLRLGALRGIGEYHPRRLDALLTLILFGEDDDPPTNRRRSRLFRQFLGLTSQGAEP